MMKTQHYSNQYQPYPVYQNQPQQPQFRVMRNNHIQNSDSAKLQFRAPTNLTFHRNSLQNDQVYQNAGNYPTERVRAASSSLDKNSFVSTSALGKYR